MMVPAPGFFHVMFGRAVPRTLALLVVVLLAGASIAPGAVDDDRLLAAIARWENSAGRVGPAGEQGEHQMHPLTVRDRGGWSAAHAAAHLHWLKAGLGRAGVDVLPFNLALAWNAGLARVLGGRCLERHYAYARAVVALYELPAGRSAAGHPEVGGPHDGMSPAGNLHNFHARVGGLEWDAEKYAFWVLLPDAAPRARDFTPVVPVSAGLNTGAPQEVSASGRRITGHPGPLNADRALPLHFRAVAAMPRWQRRPLAEATCATL